MNFGFSKVFVIGRRILFFNALSKSTAHFWHTAPVPYEKDPWFHALVGAAHSLGKGEVLSSILSGSTMAPGTRKSLLFLGRWGAATRKPRAPNTLSHPAAGCLVPHSGDRRFPCLKVIS